MVTVSLTDRLQFATGEGLSVSGPAAAHVPTEQANLITAALEAVGRRVQVSLVKHIPVGAGLGGGSADAAAVLRWAGCRDLDVAARLGSDVPFCLVGGRGRVRGKGDLVDVLPWEPMAGRTFTLLTPPFGVSTASVYRAWDDLGGRKGEGPNDLEPAALLVEPRLGAWRDRLAAAAGRTPVLAGSGSTWFVEGSYPGAGRVVVQAIRPEG
jgi:4-diphosphocytidyl-2-C-methyl-D-erythritol kinase